MNVPQFGAAEVGAVYPDRPAAFALIERDGLIALVASLEPALRRRDCGEEAGLVVAVAPAPSCAPITIFCTMTGSSETRAGPFSSAA